MQERFIKHIDKFKLLSPEDTVLIAISGGADSVVLLDLFYKADFKIALAHCNFNLRAEESDEDEQFVRQLANLYDITLHVSSFNTAEYAETNKLSIEMAARELRYNWFYQLVEKHNYHKIATGHHLNDSIETLFLNLARGTGYSGLKGIPSKNDQIIRPLLFATKEQIEAYATENDLQFRNDSSNSSTKFLRNLIRQNIVPVFKQLNPAFEQTMYNNFDNLNEASIVLDNYFDDYRAKSINNKSEQIEIPFYKILGKSPIKIHLFQLIKQYGFNSDAVEKIIEAIQKESGKLFTSATHRLLIDRDALIIAPISKLINDVYTIASLNDFNKLPITINPKELAYSDFNLIKTVNFACLDINKLTFPLTLRKWQTGDVFYPLGMSKKKKISDFLIDKKVNRLKKENTWILESNNQVVWIVNMRIDNRFKVSDKTSKVLVLEYVG